MLPKIKNSKDNKVKTTGEIFKAIVGTEQKQTYGWASQFFSGPKIKSASNSKKAIEKSLKKTKQTLSSISDFPSFFNFMRKENSEYHESVGNMEKDLSKRRDVRHKEIMDVLISATKNKRVAEKKIRSEAKKGVGVPTKPAAPGKPTAPPAKPAEAPKAEAPAKPAGAPPAKKADTSAADKATKDAADKAARDKATKEAAEEARKKAADDAAEETRKKAAEAAKKAARDKATKEAAEETRKKAAEAAEKATRDKAAKDAAEQARKKAAEAAEKAAKDKIAKDAAEETRKKAAEAAEKAARDKAAKDAAEEARKKAAEKAAKDKIAKDAAEETRKKAAEAAAEQARKKAAREAAEAAEKAAKDKIAREAAEKAKKKATPVPSTPSATPAPAAPSATPALPKPPAPPAAASTATKAVVTAATAALMGKEALATNIAKYESKGSSGRSFGKNEYNAYNKGTAGNKMIPADKPIDFSKMTISEYLRRGSLPIEDPDRLFAVGRYQIIPKTMKVLIKALKIDPNTTTLTPDVQDMLFARGLTTSVQGRGAVDDYIKGKPGVTRDAAILALAMEFASVGVPYDIPAKSLFKNKLPNIDLKKGQSFYSGIGGNKAHNSPEEVGAALDADRAKNLNFSRQPTNSGQQIYDDSVNINEMKRLMRLGNGPQQVILQQNFHNTTNRQHFVPPAQKQQLNPTMQ